MYKIEILKSADKSLRTIPTEFRNAIAKAIFELANNPRPNGCKKLKDSQFYRIRIGTYRVVYSIYDDKLLVLVVRIAHRKEAYR